MQCRKGESKVMKKIGSNNWYYIAGTIPFVFIMAAIAVVSIENIYIKAGLIFVALAICIIIVRKFWWLPYPLEKYGEMEETDLKLPDDWNVKIYLCLAMNKYPFLKRYIEIISPLFTGKEKELKIAVNPSFIKAQKSTFVEIAITREIIRYQQKAQIKSSLGLVTPMLALLSVIEAFYFLGWKEMLAEYAGYTNFFGPILVAAFVITLFLVWNKSVSQIDYKIDGELKKYFSKKEIVDYIQKWDALMIPDEKELVKEKSREMELHYIRQRIMHL